MVALRYNTTCGSLQFHAWTHMERSFQLCYHNCHVYIVLGSYDYIGNITWFHAWKGIEDMYIMILCMKLHGIVLITWFYAWKPHEVGS